MEEKLKNLKEAMNATTHSGEYFTEEMKERIRSKVKLKDERRTKKNSYLPLSLTTAALLLLAFLVSFELLNPTNQAPNVSEELVKIENITMSLIAESRSQENTTFRNIQQNGLGILQIEDKKWNEFLSDALTFENEVTIPHVQSNYDILLETSSGQRKIKVWTIEDEVYYSEFPSSEIYKMEKMKGLYLINVLQTISKRH